MLVLRCLTKKKWQFFFSEERLEAEIGQCEAEKSENVPNSQCQQ